MKDKNQIISELKKDITAKNKIIEILEILEKKSQTLQHYKQIDGRYINKLSEVIPTHKSWFNDYTQKEVNIKYAYFSKGYSDYYILTFRFTVEGKEYDTDYYLTLYKEELTPEKMSSKLNEISADIKKSIDTIKKDIENIDQIIAWHNNLVTYLVEANKEQAKISYYTRALFPKINLPYTSERDLI